MKARDKSSVISSFLQSSSVETHQDFFFHFANLTPHALPLAGDAGAVLLCSGIIFSSASSVQRALDESTSHDSDRRHS